MNQQQFSDRLPPLTTDPLPVKPPFEFTGLSARIFPLRANLDSLQKLVNGYVNIVPPEVGRFRAAVPYVYLSLLNYGKISGVVSSLGWLAQVEVFFCVPLEWYKLVDGKWRFHDLAVITPYIYVNDDISVPMGRTIYGFPKALAKLTSPNEKWLSYPLARQTLARLETAIIPELYQGKALENRVFLEVEQEQPIGNFRFPLDFNGATMPWQIASHVADTASGLGRDAQWLAQATRIFPSGPQFIPQMVERLLPNLLSPYGPGFVLNSLNLKQFRRSNDPDFAAYQALTNGPMQCTAINAGGVLGEERMLVGDLTGGYNIKLHEYTTLPIVRSLGLDIYRRSEGEAAGVVEIKPVMPMWIDVNVVYQQGQNLAWRGLDGEWKDGAGRPVSRRRPRRLTDKARFNTTVNSVIDDITGPFVFGNTTIRVLPLLASKTKLASVVDENVNAALTGPIAADPGQPAPKQVRLSVWSRPPIGTDEPTAESIHHSKLDEDDLAYVYLIASSYESVTSKSNNVGDWGKYELAFMIPVRWESMDADGEWSLRGVGLYPAYNFVDTSIAAVSRHEVQGLSTLYADFIRAKNNWLSRDDSFRASPADLLSLDCEIIPALGLGQKTATQTVLEIADFGSEAASTIQRSREAASNLANTLRRELRSKKITKAKHREQCKVARGLALELLGNRAPFEIYTLKQFRDVADPAKACFQSLQRLPRLFSTVTDVREIEATLTVTLSDYPTLSIAETLGLHATSCPTDGPGNSYVTQAVRPFYITGNMEEELGVPLLTRTGDEQWHLSASAFDSMLAEPSDRGPITVSKHSETVQDEGDPALMSMIMQEAERVGMRGGRRPISPTEATSALSAVDPQMVIEAVLSREWGSAAENARWRKGRAALKSSYENLFADFSSDRVVAAEKELYTIAYKSMANRPGSPDYLEQPVLAAIEQLAAFTRNRVAMEKSFIVLASWSVMRMSEPKEETRAERRVENEELVRELGVMLESIRNIAGLEVKGEPSPHSNLNPKVFGDYHRLRDLQEDPLDQILEVVRDQSVPPYETVEYAVLYLDSLKESVELARDCCRIQREALINKLARVYQKPDHCIRRDVVGPERHNLLPLTLSWDDEWYYGRSVLHIHGGLEDA